MKISHSGREADNLGPDLPFWTTDCVPHGVFQQDTASAFLTSICSLFSCLILGTVWHFIHSDTTTPLKSQVLLHRRVANLEQPVEKLNRLWLFLRARQTEGKKKQTSALKTIPNKISASQRSFESASTPCHHTRWSWPRGLCLQVFNLKKIKRLLTRGQMFT